jgi:ribosomal-protein-alanine N-acetyltransferase
MLRSFPELTTPRLTLSAFDSSADVSSVFAYASDPEVARFTSWMPHVNLADSAAWLDRVAKSESLETGRWRHCWAIRLRDRDPQAVGAIALAQGAAETAEVDYVLARPHWGSGLMTEAAAAVIHWAFSAAAGLTSLRSGGLAANTRSIRVMQKCGMVLERKELVEFAKFEGRTLEVLYYQITRDAWSVSRSTRLGQT